MDIGIGLPGHSPWSDGRAMVEWARRAEQRGFSSLSATDRLLWSTPEPLITLAAAAGATSRIRLLTSVLLAPLRANHALLAKMVATLDRLAGPHRLELGMAPGLREEDYVASGVDYATRGKQLALILDRLDALTNPDDPVGPQFVTPGGPPVLFGGSSDVALRRIVARGTGWICGDAVVQDILDFAPRLRQAWAEAGRPGSPRVIAAVMYALGPNAETTVAESIGSYYSFVGDFYVNRQIAIAHTSPEQVSASVAEFDKAGCDELIFMPNDPDPAQIDLLADAVGL
jgi:alkanesulfonate monooxygenase SsuD/methylene tetrahydromethanopterin reductase-like flavin-dependent oxidoreductase (luciferase family)